MKHQLALLLMLLSSSIVLFAQNKTIGKVTHFDPACANIIDAQASIEILADGFEWAEGPVWVKNGGFLLFSDVPKNTIHRWKPGEGLSVFLQPSGYTGILPYGNEPGSNGLLINLKGELVTCEHGDRRIAAMPFGLGGKRTLADNYQGMRLNSPNDITQHPNGDYYFTDPPYGMPQKEKDPTRETTWFGVYHIDKTGKVNLVDKTLDRPNGTAVSPDGKTLYVCQSSGSQPYITAYPIAANGKTGKGKVIFDGSKSLKDGKYGIFDGMKVDKQGNIFASGMNGVLILSPEGKPLGQIELGQFTANCGWGDDGSTLYITSDMYLCRVKTKTSGW